MKHPLLLLFAVLTTFALPVHALETAARQAYMIDATTHAVLLDKNGNEAMHPSSMSKLMTTYIIFRQLKDGKIKLSDSFIISEKAWKMQGSKSFLHIGKTITVEELLHGIITQSGNDACVAAAEGISGSEEAFVVEMNRTAKEMGLEKSHFTNATGWPDERHLMSARDLAVLSERIIEEFPDNYPFFAMREYTYNNITQPNRNRLLGQMGVDGLKTGHTEAGGYGIALSAKQGNRRLILVVNGLTGDNQRVEEGRKLLQYGFSAYENKTALKAGDIAAEAGVWMGRKATVPLTSADDIIVTLPTAGQGTPRFILKYNGPLQAPVMQGDHVADLVVEAPGQAAQTVPLVAAETVEKLSAIARIPAVIKYYLFGHSQ